MEQPFLSEGSYNMLNNVSPTLTMTGISLGAHLWSHTLEMDSKVLEVMIGM